MGTAHRVRCKPRTNLTTLQPSPTYQFDADFLTGEEMRAYREHVICKLRYHLTTLPAISQHYRHACLTYVYVTETTRANFPAQTVLALRPTRRQKFITKRLTSDSNQSPSIQLGLTAILISIPTVVIFDLTTRRGLQP